MRTYCFNFFQFVSIWLKTDNILFDQTFKTNTMKKLTKKQAVKLFNEGRTIYLCSSKITPQIIQYSPWFSWYDFKKSVCDEQGETFETVVNSFSYYNCDKERGKLVHYYAYVD